MQHKMRQHSCSHFLRCRWPFIYEALKLRCHVEALFIGIILKGTILTYFCFYGDRHVGHTLILERCWIRAWLGVAVKANCWTFHAYFPAAALPCTPLRTSAEHCVEDFSWSWILGVHGGEQAKVRPPPTPAERILWSIIPALDLEVDPQNMLGGGCICWG